MPTVSVIVPAMNAANTIGGTLEALAAQSFDGNLEVVVVDDGSDDETPKIVAEASGPVRLIKQTRKGPAAARNRGALEAAASIFAFTDADCVPHPDWLRAGLHALDSADLVQGAVLPDPSATRSPFDRTLTVTREYGLYETANLIVRREAFEQVGGFEEWLVARVGKPLAEDVWFGWSVKRAGGATAFCEGALVHHAVFRRGARDYILERLRLAYFPAMARQIPELRQTFFHRRYFMNRRSLEFDLALIGVLARFSQGARGSRRRHVPLILAVPYLRSAYRGARPWGMAAPRVLGADFLADLVGLGALLYGSVKRRSPVL